MSERECHISAINGVTMPQRLRSLTLDLPFPPTVNGYWRNIGDNRTIISKQGRIFRQTVAEIVLANRAALKIGKPVCVFVTYCPPDKRVRDLDNYGKALFDALTHAGVWQDDSLIREMHITWGQTGKPGKTRITINELAALPKE